MSPTDLIKRLLSASNKPPGEAPERPVPDPARDTGESQAELAAVALSDAGTTARTAAVKRLSDLEALRECLLPTTPGSVRLAAVARYSLLLKSDDPALDLSARLEAVRHCPDDTVLAHLAQSARLEAVRREALDRLGSPGACLQAALHDPVRRQRKFAVERTADRETLEAIATRSQDRGIARLARRRLQALEGREAEQAAGHSRAADLCAAMEALAEARWDDNLHARRRRLENQWEQLDVALPRVLVNRFAQARDACAARRAPQTENEAAELLAALEREARTLTHHPEPDAARLTALRESLARTRRAWSRLDADPAADAQFRTRYWRLECWCADARRFLDQHQVIEHLVAGARRLPTTEAEPLLRHARELQHALRAAPWHSGFPLPERLREAHQTVRVLEAQARRAGRTRLQQLRHVQHLVSALEQAIEERAWAHARHLIHEILRQTGEPPAEAGIDQRNR